MQRHQISNEEAILNYIRRYGPTSKATIAKQTGITAPTVSTICSHLLKRKLIREYGEEKAYIGRPSTLLQFNKNIEFMLIVHIRTHNLFFYTVDLGSEILRQERISIIGKDPEAILEDISEGIKRALEEDTGKIKSIGIVMRGPVDSQQGISIYSPHGKWSNVPFKYILEERFHLPVYVDNDVRALTIGEYYYGKGQNATNLLVVKFSYGLGSAFLYNGELYRGFNDSSGELGYMVITTDEGKEIAMEEVASETALRNYVIGELNKGRPSLLKDDITILQDAFKVEPIYDAALKGDELALEALHEAGYYLGVALANTTNFLNPERIVLSSAMGKAVELMDPIIKKVLQAHSHRAQPVEIVYSGRGSYYTLLGMMEIVSTQRVKEGSLG